MPKPRQRLGARKSSRKKAVGAGGGGGGFGTGVAVGVGIAVVAVVLFFSTDLSPRPEYVPPVSSSPPRRATGAAGSGPREPVILPGWNDSVPLPFVELYKDLEPCEGGYYCARPNPRNRIAVRDNGAADFCDFDVLRPGELSFERFEREYRNKRPFVIDTRATDWTDPSHFTRDFFAGHFADMPTDVGGSLDIVRYSGKGYMEMGTGEFMDEFMAPPEKRKWASEPLYTFSRISGASPEDAKSTGMLWMKELEGLFTLGGKKDFSRKTYCLFMMGPAGSGTAFHFHQEAWTGLIFGRKRWIFYDPEHRAPPGGFYPSVAATQWLEEDYRDLAPEDKPLECMQHAGQMLYVPEHWFHAVVNVDDVVAISMQNVTKHSAELKLVQAKDFDKLRKATERYPHRADVFFSYARALLQADSKKHCAEALPQFDAALALDSRFVLARVEKAKCLEVVAEAAGGGPGPAALELNRALELNPNSFSTRREVKRLIGRHPGHDFPADAENPGAMADWTEADWVVGPFEDIRELIAANLDMEQLTSK